MTATDRVQYTRLVDFSRTEQPCDVILHNDITNDNIGEEQQQKVSVGVLRLMMISCEDHPPYGPSENTAKMFLDLIEMAYLAKEKRAPCTTTSPRRKLQEITITVYEAKQKDYPSTEQEWQSYDGILLPGSFSSAYGKEDWIERLKEVIQSEIHEKGRKTMAVCFGHQVFAHSFMGENKSYCSGKGDSGGLAVPCPASTQVGRFTFQSSNLKWLSLPKKSQNPNSSINILYTHGDMVESLPKCAISLGGTETVPIQAAVYFQKQQSPKDNEVPYAYTFQGHPEYATKTGINTFHNVIDTLNEKGKVSDESLKDIKKSCLEMFHFIQEDSISVMIEVAKIFTWF